MSASETFVARLDRVPLNRFHWKLLAVSGIGWMFDAMDVLLIGFLVTPITREFALVPAQVGLVPSSGFVGMFFGAAISGRLADRYGRRVVFASTLVLFSVGGRPLAAKVEEVGGVWPWTGAMPVPSAW